MLTIVRLGKYKEHFSFSKSKTLQKSWGSLLHFTEEDIQGLL